MIRNCKEIVNCPKNWSDFKETADQKVRHCEQCEKPIFLCTTQEEILVYGGAGECIAVRGSETAAPFELTPKEEFLEMLDQYADVPDLLVSVFATTVSPENVDQLVEAVFSAKNEKLIQHLMEWYDSAPVKDEDWEKIQYLIAGSFREGFDPEEYSRTCRARDKYAIYVLRNSNFDKRNWAQKLFK